MLATLNVTSSRYIPTTVVVYVPLSVQYQIRFDSSNSIPYDVLINSLAM